MENAVYTNSFFQNRKQNALKSAQQICPVIYRQFQPQSIIDLGCGTGEYLKVFSDLGCKTVLGVDGDYIRRDMLAIEQKNFIAFDLRERFSIADRFDIAMSVEVAEHLPLDRARSFVEDLTQLSDIVLFSAATSHQGGTDHINEQPISFWINLFEEKGYLPFDMIRSFFWDELEEGSQFLKRNGVIFIRASSPATRNMEEPPKINRYDVIGTKVHNLSLKALRDYYSALQEGKDWLEQQYTNYKREYESLKAYTEELQKEKDWIEEQYNRSIKK